MAGKADTKKTEKRSLTAEVNRGTQDELEILSIILEHNPALRQVVLEKLRQACKRVEQKITKAI